MWLSAIKLAVSAGSKIYANKQKTKMAMSDAQLMHAERMARGDEAYQGKLLEARKSKLIADMTQEFKEEENQIMGQLGNDPIAKLKARELDLRAMDNEQKRMQADARLNLDKSRAMMNQDLQEEKLDQNEELAKLRANTSIEKTILGKTLPSSDKMPGNVAIIRKTGE